jgi:hypothetical protein
MKFVYLLPFSYFLHTRLSKGSLEFHALFEWGAALVLTGAFGIAGMWGSMLFAFEAYFAFISLYEVGYLFNDLISTKNEIAARLRGPADATRAWLAAWVLSRLMAFAFLTLLLDMAGRGDWWLFFGSMLAVFALHNLLQDKELKASTFLWLAWFRFMAPVVFVVQPAQRMGIALGAASLYAGFRLFGYLDSKALLVMHRRQSMTFRATFFLMPLFSAISMFDYPEAMGFRCMAFYYAALVCVALAVQNIRAGSWRREKKQH